MRISIRINILTIFTILLVIIGSIIISINYYSSNAILLRFAEKLVIGANSNIEQKINNFLQPVNERIAFGARSIQNGLITPQANAAFTKFLLQFLADQHDFSGVHWSDAQGDFYFIERNEKGNFDYELITCAMRRCVAVTRQLDAAGNLLTQSPAHPTTYDPRVRPWYVKAAHAQHYILSDAYLFFHRPGLGLTGTYPVYAADKKLYGMLSIDIRLNALSEFIANLALTPNANIFIFEGQNRLLAAKELQNFSGKKFPQITDIAVPWALASVIQHKKTNQAIFPYIYHKQQYLALYNNLQNMLGNPWYIAIVLPVKDFTATLIPILTASILTTIVILLFGVLLILVVSKTISRPIVALTYDARSIKGLELSKVQYQHLSHIKEINYLQQSFMAMKQSLASFIRYVPITLVKQLIATGDVAHVGGENREMTFLFVDIQGFTTLSENMEPQKLMNYLSEYLEAMSKIIFSHKGTVDKYIGDAIMAFWGAPGEDALHAVHACQCAIEMVEELARLNQQWQIEDKPTLNIRLGLHTGNAVVGNIGSDDRLSYTALGDSVNLASRIEGINKLYGTTLIVSETTYQMAAKSYKFRLLDYVAVRGKQQGVHIYELIMPRHVLNTVNLDSYNKEFLLAFTCYQQGNWDEAMELFTKINVTHTGDNLTKIYLDRCSQFKITPPVAWQGVWRL